MAMGNRLGFSFDPAVSLQTLFGYAYGSFVVEWSSDTPVPQNAVMLGTTTAEQTFVYHDEQISLNSLCTLYENRLEDVYPCNIEQTSDQPIPAFSYTASEKKVASPAVRTARPLVLIPAFPREPTANMIRQKRWKTPGRKRKLWLCATSPQMRLLRLFSGLPQRRRRHRSFYPRRFFRGDEPDGSGKFITAFFRSEAVRTAVTELLDRRGGLMADLQRFPGSDQTGTCTVWKNYRSGF